MIKYLNLIKTVVLFLALFISTQTRAQRGTVPIPYQADYNRMTRNQSMNNARPWMGMNFLFKNRVDLADISYNFRVFFKDSTKMFVTSQLHVDSAKHTSYIIAVNKTLPKTDPGYSQKIYPGETAGLVQFNDNGNIYAKPTDSCWLFKVMDGKINVYSLFPIKTGLDNEAVAGIQIGDGPIETFSPAKLYAAIKEDGAAVSAWAEQAYITAIKRYNRKHK